MTNSKFGTKVCLGCEKTFSRNSFNHHYCNQDCRAKYSPCETEKSKRFYIRKTPKKLDCLECQKEFVPNYNQKFCSSNCRTINFRKVYNPTRRKGIRTFTCISCDELFDADRKRKFCKKTCVANQKRIGKEQEKFDKRQKILDDKLNRQLRLLDEKYTRLDVDDGEKELRMLMMKAEHENLHILRN